LQVIEKFSKSGIRCAINIDPIIPLITDSTTDISNIIDGANDIGIKFISGAILRIRYDIWERIKYILQLLNRDNYLEIYEKIFKFKDPITFKNNLVANKTYTDSILNYLRQEVHKQKMKFGFPSLNSKKMITNKNNTDRVTLFDFIK
jgi:DNA repair photolyase